MIKFMEGRERDITKRIQAAFCKPFVTYSFVSAESTFSAWKNGYFPRNDLLFAELTEYTPVPYKWCSPESIGSDTDIVIVVCGAGPLDLDVLTALRERIGIDPIIALWLFDNHTSQRTNLDLVHAADFVFFSHRYAVDYLFQHHSVVCQHIPACTAQWTTRQAALLFAQREQSIRKHKLLINYVAYSSFSELRQRVLKEYESALECADVFLMPRTDRSRYGAMSAEERFDEWARYKATVIVPLDRDLSTRVFDALLAGMIPIIPNGIEDIDVVIPPSVQDTLGIIRTDSLELPEIRKAAQRAFAAFDAMGIDGCRARHEFALGEHMLVNRVTSMLYMLWLFGTKKLVIEFASDQDGPALYWRQAERASDPAVHQ